MNKLRNIGIIAHINAGKTTTTERILFHAGSTRTVGDVDKGNTVTDYLIQERDRGITITSSAVSFDWLKKRVNLIDTPGHVDFTIEVERSLSVLDGAVTILDSSAGVEAQTITVWNQARKYHLPNIIYLNKYDKPLADYKDCLHDIIECLGVKPCLLHIPVKTQLKNKTNTRENQDIKLLDVINRKYLEWQDPLVNYGTKFSSCNLQEASTLDPKYLDSLAEQREKLVNVLCDCDDMFADYVINKCDNLGEVPGDELEQAIRRATINCRISPVLIGSSFKFIGIQQLMDSIVKFLPDPLEREQYLLTNLMQGKSPSIRDASSESEKKFCGFIFKIIHEPRLGPLAFIKVSNGLLKKSQKVRVLTSGKEENIKSIYRVFADELNESNEPIGCNDIVAVTGLRDCRTGDVLVGSGFSTKNEGSNSRVEVNKDTNEDVPFWLLNGSVLLPKISNVEPVYFCSIESKNMSQQAKLEVALSNLVREDPSFRFDIDEYGLTTVRGMGKLHLEIIRDRIETEYNIQPILGPLQIQYRETINGQATEQLNLDKSLNGVKCKLSISIHVESKANIGTWKPNMLRLDTSPKEGASLASTLRREHRKAIELGIMSALNHGPSFGYQLIDCCVTLMDFYASRACTPAIISSAASQCLTNALKLCQGQLLEPIFNLEVVTPAQYNGSIQADLQAKRRAVIKSVSGLNNDMTHMNTARSATVLIKAQVPIAKLADYCEFLRVATSGRASFSMAFDSYQTALKNFQ